MPIVPVKQQPAGKPAKRPRRQSASAPSGQTHTGCLGRTLKWSAGILVLLVGCSVLFNLGPRTPEPQRTATAVVTTAALPQVATPEPTLPQPDVEQRSSAVSLGSPSTATPVVAADAPATETDAPLSIHTPLHPSTPTTTPLPTPTSAPVGPVANTNANVREGPGVSFAIVGSAQSGQALDISGQDSSGQWLQLASGFWIAASLVNNIPPNLPVTAVAAQLPGGNPTSAPTPASTQATAPTSTPSWQREERGVIFTSECPCDQGDILNCSDFGIAMDAQACYMRCMDLVGRDVHRLDRDNDGGACEWRW